MHLRAPLSAVLCAVLSGACGGSTKKPGPPDAGSSGTAKIDALGGSLSVGGATITVPPGALPEGTSVEITMAVASDQPPVSYTAYSPLYRFGPAGTSFQQPVTVSLPFAPPAVSSEIAVFWSRSNAPGYERLAATIAGSLATVSVTHFSEGFVAAGSSDTECPVPQESCSGSCVSLEADPNCGECGRVCAAGQACFAGILGYGDGRGMCRSIRQWAQWPVPPDAPTQYTNDLDTALDQVTGLTWQRYPADHEYLWEDAVAYCSGLSLAGNEDWRMPTRIELLSIVDSSKAGPTINETSFPQTQSKKYWCYTISPLVSSERFFVNFASGECDTTVAAAANGVTAQVRCVR